MKTLNVMDAKLNGFTVCHLTVLGHNLTHGLCFFFVCTLGSKFFLGFYAVDVLQRCNEDY